MKSEKKFGFDSHIHYKVARKICEVLQGEGYEALFAGGAVRDALMGREPKDFDIATSALPEDIEKLFEKTVGVGKAFGVILVVLDGISVEVATFRKDGSYKDGRRPDSVEFSNLKEDALRRDFTINAMYFDPIAGEVVDLVGGEKDLESRILRTVGNPEERFAEDHLRILRAIRFSAQLDVKIESLTWKAVLKLASTVKTVSKERITEELTKTWTTPKRVEAFQRLISSKLLEILLPEVDTEWKKLSESSEARALQLFNFYDLEKDKVVLWASIFLCSPPNALQMFQASLSRLVFSRETQKQIEFILRHLISLWDPRVSKGQKLEWLGALDSLKLLVMAERWIAVEGRGGEAAKELADLSKRLMDLTMITGELPESFISGEDLIEAGIKKGPQMGALLKQIYHLQLEGVLNSRAQALKYLKSL